MDDDRHLDRRIDWLRRVEAMDEETARRALHSRLRSDAREAESTLRKLSTWPTMPPVARAMFERPSEMVRLRRIVDLIPARARVLDVGCGPGVVAGTLALHDRIGAYLGIDLNSAKIDSARDMADTNGLDQLRFEVGDAGALPTGTIGDLAPDTVLILEVLEHLEDPAAVLTSIADLLPTSANIIFSVPLLGRIEACWGHRTLYGADAILGLVEACGLHLVDVDEVHNTWALATASRKAGSSEQRAGTPPLTIRRVSPARLETTSTTASRLRQPPRLRLTVEPGRTVSVRSEAPEVDWLRVEVECRPPDALDRIEVDTSNAAGDTIRRWRPDLTRLAASGRRTLIVRPQDAEMVTTPPSPAQFAHTRFTAGAAPAELTIWRFDYAGGYEHLLPDGAPESPEVLRTDARAREARGSGDGSPSPSRFTRIEDRARTLAQAVVARWPRLRGPALTTREYLWRLRTIERRRR